MKWLHFKFSNVTDADTEVRIKCVVRAYLFYLVGCTLFGDKSGTRVFISYVSLFKDLGVVSTYAWGTTILAYLYRQLGYAFRGGVKQISSYLPLLEVLLVFNACFKKNLVMSIILILKICESDMDIRALFYYATPTQYGIYE